MVQREEIKKKPEIKYLFQGQYAISKHWVDIDIEWFEENFSTRESQSYKRLFQTNIEGQSGIIHPMFIF